MLAEAYGRSKRYTEAIQVLRKGLEQNRYFREFYGSLGVQNMTLGNYREAVQVIADGLALSPDDTTLLVLRKKVQAAMLDTP